MPIEQFPRQRLKISSAAARALGEASTAAAVHDLLPELRLSLLLLLLLLL